MEVFALQSGAELAVAVAYEQARLIFLPPPRRGSTDAGFFFLPLYFLVSVCRHFCPSR